MEVMLMSKNGRPDSSLPTLVLVPLFILAFIIQIIEDWFVLLAIGFIIFVILAVVCGEIERNKKDK